MTTATIFLTAITPALAQNPNPYPGRDWGFSFSPQEEYGDKSECGLSGILTINLFGFG